MPLPSWTTISASDNSWMSEGDLQRPALTASLSLMKDSVHKNQENVQGLPLQGHFLHKLRLFVQEQACKSEMLHIINVFVQVI